MREETIVGLFVFAAIGVFFYLSFTIGTFRLDRARYNSYIAYFEDTSGLEKKDPVTIAGVEVGWVESLKLSPDGMAKVTFLVSKQNKLAKNSRAMIRREGLIGNRYLEIDPGDSQTGYLVEGSTLGYPSEAPPTIGDLLGKFGDIANSIQAVASSLESVVATKEGKENMKQTLDGFAKGSDRFAQFSDTMDRTLRRNEENINNTLSDLKQVTNDLREAKLDKLSNTMGTAFERVGEASGEVREGFSEAGKVIEKINTGKGLVGKLINEEEMASDFKKTIRNVKDYTGKMQAIDVMVDMHSENMIRDWNTKGYFELRLRPTYDYFYVLQIVADEKGTITREKIDTKRIDRNGNLLAPPRPQDAYRAPDKLRITTRRENDILFGFQFGKRFDRLAFRIGLFENTFGLGVDWYVPLKTDFAHWVTTFEMFDTKGINRRDDTRPHLKWLNRVYFMKHLYTAFGFDDFVSKHSATPFFGGGIRFSDKDLKYLLPSLPLSNVRAGRVDTD